MARRRCASNVSPPARGKTIKSQAVAGRRRGSHFANRSIRAAGSAGGGRWRGTRRELEADRGRGCRQRREAAPDRGCRGSRGCVLRLRTGVPASVARAACQWRLRTAVAAGGAARRRFPRPQLRWAVRFRSRNGTGRERTGRGLLCAEGSGQPLISMSICGLFGNFFTKKSRRSMASTGRWPESPRRMRWILSSMCSGSSSSSRRVPDLKISTAG